MMAATTSENWKHFPRYMILAMAFVMAVNVRFIYVAVTTFPGVATNDDFDTSNRYNAVMQAAAAQNALGWTERVSAQGLEAAVDLAGPDHAPLEHAVLTGQMLRPLGDSAPIPLTFHETTAGHYVVVPSLPAAGQWELVLRIEHGGHTAHVNRRVVVG
jgi:nitrogen fixation protein FixH